MLRPRRRPFAPLYVECDCADPAPVPQPRLRPAQAPAPGLPELRPVRRPPGPVGLTPRSRPAVGIPVAESAVPAGTGGGISPAGQAHADSAAAWLHDALGIVLPGGLLALAL